MTKSTLAVVESTPAFSDNGAIFVKCAEHDKVFGIEAIVFVVSGKSRVAIEQIQRLPREQLRLVFVGDAIDGEQYGVSPARADGVDEKRHEKAIDLGDHTLESAESTRGSNEARSRLLCRGVY